VYLYSYYDRWHLPFYKGEERRKLNNDQDNSYLRRQYPRGAKLGMYVLFLKILYERDKISRATYLNSRSFVEEQRKRKEADSG